MSVLEMLARAEHALRPSLSALPPKLATRLFSSGRTTFSKRFAQERPEQRFPEVKPVTAWDLTFRMPLWNAAGMFKYGEGYEVVSRQGAGAYVAGTTTSRPRTGNEKFGVRWPTVSYARSRSASNWMGLPNEGHAVVAKRLATLSKVEGCPIGASVSAEPLLEDSIAITELIDGMQLYAQAGVDYLELNESCPNVPGGHGGHGGHGSHGGPQLDDGLIARLERVSSQFLKKRMRRLPVVVKFSVDTNPKQLDDLLRMLIALEFDGIILGNTSTQYAHHRHGIHSQDRPLYDAFTSQFGGGLSGQILREDSLELATRAQEIVSQARPAHEFHVIRCGGINSADDLKASARHGVVLNQWYTGYYERFGVDGHDVYQKLSGVL